jgi:hypothetical protein
VLLVGGCESLLVSHEVLVVVTLVGVVTTLVMGVKGVPGCSFAAE